MALVADVNLVDQRSLEVLRDELGLDEPAVKQYGLWLGRALKGDLGTAFHGRQPVISNIARAAPVTLELGLMALIISLLVAIPIGVFSAIRADTWTDYGGRLFAVFGIAVPDFILGVCMVILPAIWFNWTPAVVYIEFLDDPIGNFKQFILPALAIGFRLTSVLARMTRSSMLEVLRQDYIRTAWSKGLGERAVVSATPSRTPWLPPSPLSVPRWSSSSGERWWWKTSSGFPGWAARFCNRWTAGTIPSLWVAPWCWDLR